MANKNIGHFWRDFPFKTHVHTPTTYFTTALLYGLEACPLTKSDLQSLDFVINRFFMKLFKTKNIEIVKHCQEYFGFAFVVTCSLACCMLLLVF